MGLSYLLVLALFLFVSSQRLMRWTPFDDQQSSSLTPWPMTLS
jgi:hypothetical protein